MGGAQYRTEHPKHFYSHSKTGDIFLSFRRVRSLSRPSDKTHALLLLQSAGFFVLMDGIGDKQRQ